MTTPFWSGTSWTSRPMASQRDGLPPAPTLTFLDSRYKHMHVHTWLIKLFSKNVSSCITHKVACSDNHIQCDSLLQVAPSTAPFLGGAQGWLADGCIHHGKEPISYPSSSSSLCPPPTPPLPPPPPCPFWQTLELVPIAWQYCDLHTDTHTHTGRHWWGFRTTEPMQLSQEVHLLLLIYVL